MTKQPLFAVVAPVMRDNQVVYLLSISVTVERIRELTQQVRAPSGWTIGAVDRPGRILARNSRHHEFIGKMSTRDLQENAIGAEGTWNGFTIDGQAI